MSRCTGYPAFAGYDISSIIHPYEIKPFWRRDRAASGAAARIQRGAQIVGGPAALADPHQRADHRADLAMQERARRGQDIDLKAISHHIELVERPHRRF